MDLNLSIYKFPNIEVGLTGHRWPRLVVGKLDQQMVESLIHRYLRTLELVVGPVSYTHLTLPTSDLV